MDKKLIIIRKKIYFCPILTFPFKFTWNLKWKLLDNPGLKKPKIRLREKKKNMGQKIINLTVDISPRKTSQKK